MALPGRSSGRSALGTRSRPCPTGDQRVALFVGLHSRPAQEVTQCRLATKRQRRAQRMQLHTVFFVVSCIRLFHRTKFEICVTARPRLSSGRAALPRPEHSGRPAGRVASSESSESSPKDGATTATMRKPLRPKHPPARTPLGLPLCYKQPKQNPNPTKRPTRRKKATQQAGQPLTTQSPSYSYAYVPRFKTEHFAGEKKGAR